MGTERRFPVVALVSSAGGLRALSSVLGPLPASFPAAVIALQHTSPQAHGALAEILNRRTALDVVSARDGDQLCPGRVLVIPPGKHMIGGSDERVRLINADGLPPARPSADLLLSTLAVALGERLTAVVLTGGGNDGSLGAQAVHCFGGRVLVQDEETSEVFGMPRATMLADSPMPALPLPQIAARLQRLLSEPRPAALADLVHPAGD